MPIFSNFLENIKQKLHIVKILDFIKQKYQTLTLYLIEKISIFKNYAKTIFNGEKKIKFSLEYFSWEQKIIALSILLFILLISMAFITILLTKKPTKTQAIPVEVSEVRKDILIKKIPAIGVLQANESITLRPEVAGHIDKILFEEGQTIQKESLLIALEDSIAKANLKEATAEYELRKNEFDRANTLLEKNVISITDKENAYTKLQIAEAAHAKAITTLSKMNITAPFEGFLGIRKVCIGDYVSVGQELVNLVDINPIKVDFRVPEIYLEHIKNEQIIEMTSEAFPQKVFTGMIYAIDPQIDPLSHSILVRAKIENSNYLLKPGLFVNLSIILNQNPNALFIPNEALIPELNKHFVYKIINGIAKLTEVQIGERFENEVEVITGLDINDLVVKSGQMKIQDQMPITILSGSLQ